MDNDLQPRILRGLSMATVAIAVTVGSAYATTPATTAAAAPATIPAAPSSQIWECVSNGIRTFSDKRCGIKSSIRELNPINGMEPTPVLPPARSYQPQVVYPPEYYPSAQESTDDAYPVLVAFPFIARRSPERAHRPYKHAHAPAPRRN